MAPPPLRSFSALVIVVIGCGGPADGVRDSGDDSSDAAPNPEADANGLPDASTVVTDFMSSGNFAVTESTGSVATDGCSLDYTLYEPESAPSAPLVILGHGFARSQDRMAGIARHLSSFGVRVATPDYCHLSALDSDHEQNGRDAAALSAALGDGGPVIHAGQSAGGLAGVLAANQDDRAIAVLGLDLVDADGLAVAAASNMAMPMFGMAGEPAQCNSENNGVDMFQGAAQWVARVNGATHCDFEDPTNGLCTAFCGGEGGGLPTVRALAAAFVSWQFAIDPSGEQWASPAGSQWQRLVADGVLSPL